MMTRRDFLYRMITGALVLSVNPTSLLPNAPDPTSSAKVVKSFDASEVYGYGIQALDTLHDPVAIRWLRKHFRHFVPEPFWSKVKIIKSLPHDFGRNTAICWYYDPYYDPFNTEGYCGDIGHWKFDPDNGVYLWVEGL